MKIFQIGFLNFRLCSFSHKLCLVGSLNHVGEHIGNHGREKPGPSSILLIRAQAPCSSPCSMKIISKFGFQSKFRFRSKMQIFQIGFLNFRLCSFSHKLCFVGSLNHGGEHMGNHGREKPGPSSFWAAPVRAPCPIPCSIEKQ